MARMRGLFASVRILILRLRIVLSVRGWYFDMKTIEQDLVKELFEYRDGVLYNRVTRAPRAVKGNPAGRFNKSNGYNDVVINGKRYQISRFIWIYHNGPIPEGMQIDHINRNPADDRIENLRLATQTQNEWNKPKNKCNFESGKWRARIKVHGKNIHIGMFDRKEDAIAAYDAKAKKLHGDFFV